VRWVAVDDSPSTAEQWRKSGIALDDAKVFSNAYIDIEDSKLWIEAGFSATVARQFDAEGFDVEDAIASRVRGLTVSAALRELRDGGFDGEDGEDHRLSAINIPNSFADDHPQVAARIQSQGVIWWGLVTQHLERLVKLTTEEPAVTAALGEQAGFLPRSKTAIDWASREPNVFQLLASLARGYGTGRLALGTHEQVLQYSTAKEDADQRGAQISLCSNNLEFEEVAACSEDPAALAAAVYGVSAEEFEDQAQDAIRSLMFDACRQGFLVAIAEDLELAASNRG
jgi:hypothetical protein